MLLTIKVPPEALDFRAKYPANEAPGKEIQCAGVRGTIVMITVDDPPNFLVDFWDLAGKDMMTCRAWLITMGRVFQASRVEKIESKKHRTVYTVPLSADDTLSLERKALTND